MAKQAVNVSDSQLALIALEDPNKDIGVKPQPRPTLPPSPTFATENYSYIDRKLIINLPVRPDNLDKRGTDKFRNVIKRIVIDLEKKNRNQIIIYRRDANWWQCGGNSLLFYKHYLEKRHQLPTVNLRIDNDYGTRWPDHGDCFMIKKPDAFVENLISKAHAKLILQTPELVIVELPLSFTDIELEAFQSIKKNKLERINKLLVPKIVNPHTRQRLDDLTLIIINRVRKLDQPSRELFGYEGAKLASKLSREFISMSNGRIPAIEYYANAVNGIRDIMEWLAHIQKFELFNTTELCRIAELATDVKERFINELTIARRKQQEEIQQQQQQQQLQQRSGGKHI